MSKTAPLREILDCSDELFGSSIDEEIVISDIDARRLNEEVQEDLLERKTGFEDLRPFVEADLGSESDTLLDPDYNPAQDEESILEPDVEPATVPMPPPKMVWRGSKVKRKGGGSYASGKPKAKPREAAGDASGGDLLREPLGKFIKWFGWMVPAIMVLSVLLLIWNVGTLISGGTGADEGYLHHKLFLLEKQVSKLDSQYSTLSDQQQSILAGAIPTGTGRVVLENGTDVTGYLDDLQDSMAALVGVVDELEIALAEDTAKSEGRNLTKEELDYIVDSLRGSELIADEEVVAVPEKAVPAEPAPAAPSSYRTNYGAANSNAAGTARVIEELTSTPQRKRVRTAVWDRVLHGFTDFARRQLFHKTLRSPIVGLDNIDVTSDVNSVNNPLVEDPHKYWQALNEDMPISYTLALREPIYLKEAGISQPRYKYLLDSAPQLVELFVRPKQFDKPHLDTIRRRLGPYYNQDFQTAVLRSSFAKVGQMHYNVKSNQQYQRMDIPKEVREILMDFEVDWVMFVVDSNWGNANFTVLDTVRIFGMDQVEMRRYLSGEPLDVASPGAAAVPNLGDDTPL